MLTVDEKPSTLYKKSTCELYTSIAIYHPVLNGFWLLYCHTSYDGISLKLKSNDLRRLDIFITRQPEAKGIQEFPLS